MKTEVLPLKEKREQSRVWLPTQKQLIEVIGRGLFWLLVLLIVFYTMAPFFYAISVSFRTNAQVLVEARYLPEEFRLDNYQNLLSDNDFMRTMRNSAVVATVTVLLSLIVGSFAAYALGRVRFRGRMVVLYTVLAMTMFPQISILSGLFAIVNDLDIYGSTAALMFTYPIFTLPFTVWVLTSFMRALPRDLEEAAYVDGASPLQTFFYVMLPLVAPGLVTAGLLAFIAAWNEFLFALSFTQSPEKYTVPVAITSFTEESAFDQPWGQIMAATVIVTVPLIVLTLVLQRRILAGLTAGAVKG
jgi:trehalose/maltose transport system permease protein